MTDVEVRNSTRKIAVPGRQQLLVVAGLAIALAGMIIEMLGGVAYPKVPPGPIMVVVAAVGVYFVRWRWIPAVAVLVGGFLTMGLFTTVASRLTDPAAFGKFLGTWVQLIGQVIAVVAAVAALIVATRGARARR